MKKILENISGYTKLNTQADIDRMMKEFDGFSDSGYTDIDYIEGEDVNVKTSDRGATEEHIGAGVFIKFDRPIDLETTESPAVQMIEVVFNGVTKISFCPDGSSGMQRYRSAEISIQREKFIFTLKADDDDNSSENRDLLIICSGILWRKINYSI